jgi:hypothetical protein
MAVAFCKEKFNMITSVNGRKRKGTQGFNIFLFSICGRTLIGCFIVAAFLLILIEIKSLQRLIRVESLDARKVPDADYSQKCPCPARAGSLSSRKDVISLYAGELPGYTGWARPEYTKVSLFHLLKSSADEPSPRIGENWVIQIKCSSRQCLTSPTNRGALFFARAYGPSVIPGYVGLPVRQGGNDIYDVTFHFFDEGSYFVELILTFSESFPFENYPLSLPNQTEPSYEGYMVQGFPMQIVVTASVAKDKHQPASSLPLCTPEQLNLPESVNQQISFARWKVYDKNIHPLHTPRTANASFISLHGYQVNSY